MTGSVLLAAAVLLAGAGAAKLRAPDSAAAMLRRAWRPAPRGPSGRHLVRVSGVAEIAVALVVVASGGRLGAGLLAGCYLAFLAVAARLQLSGERASCGCFGATDSPVGIPHLVVNAVALTAAVVALVRPVGPAGGWLDDGVTAGAVGIAQAVLLAYLAFLAMTALPELAAARRRLMESA